MLTRARRRCIPLREPQAIAACCGAGLTLLVIVLSETHAFAGTTSAWPFFIGFIVLVIPACLAHALRIGYFVFVVAPIINAAVSFLAVSFVGCVIRAIKRARRK